MHEDIQYLLTYCNYLCPTILTFLPHKHKQTQKKLLMQKWKPVLPLLEEMVKADRQRSTATTFRSMMADGMKGRNRKEPYIHTCTHTHVHTHVQCASFHPPTSKSWLLSCWCWVSVREKAVAPSKLRQVWWEPFQTFIAWWIQKVKVCYCCTRKSGYVGQRCRTNGTVAGDHGEHLAENKCCCGGTSSGMKNGRNLSVRRQTKARRAPDTKEAAVRQQKQLFMRGCGPGEKNALPQVVQRGWQETVEGSSPPPPPPGWWQDAAVRFHCGNDGWQACKSCSYSHLLWSHQHPVLFDVAALSNPNREEWTHVSLSDQEIFCVGVCFQLFPGTCLLSESEVSAGVTTSGSRADWIVVFISRSKQPAWSIRMKRVKRPTNTAKFSHGKKQQALMNALVAVCEVFGFVSFVPFVQVLSVPLRLDLAETQRCFVFVTSSTLTPDIQSKNKNLPALHPMCVPVIATAMAHGQHGPTTQAWNRLRWGIRHTAETVDFYKSNSGKSARSSSCTQ